MLSTFLITLCFAPAFAADEEDTLGTTKKTSDIPDASTFEDDDDMGIPSFTSTKTATEDDKEKDLTAFTNPSALTMQTKMPVDVVGKTVLGDNFAASVSIVDQAAVVVDLPVYYAASRAEFDGIAYWLVAEIYADGKKVAESRMQVTRDAIAEKGPSVHFFRMFAPVSGAAGVLEVKVSKATSASAKPTLIFTRSVSYNLAGS